jgi:ArsR family transcriptional regulator, lead/cadmium/zinc/bismuth-responsive transcriptional repressor
MDRSGATLDHEHPVDPARVDAARERLISDAEARRLSELLGLVADPIRSRILIALGTVDSLCVGDLALALGVSDDAVSYGLKLLRTAGLVAYRKDGRAVMYRLADGFPHQLVEHCLRELLAIGSPAAVHAAVRAAGPVAARGTRQRTR